MLRKLTEMKQKLYGEKSLHNSYVFAKFFKRRIIKNNCLLQQPSNFLTDEYYNPRKLRLTKIKINEIFTAKIFHNMKKLYKILFLGGGRGSNFPGGRQFSWGTYLRGVIFRVALFPEAFYLFNAFTEYIDIEKVP